MGALFLVIAMTIQFVMSYHRTKADVMERIDYKMELAQKDVISELHDMCDAVSDIATYLPQYIQDTTTQHQMIESVLWRYPNLFSCYFHYAPDYIHRPSSRIAVGALRAGKDSIVSYGPASVIDYTDRDWYKGAMLSDETGYWSSSYNDVDTDSLIFTYSRKAYDEKGRVMGVAGADYTLSWTKQLLQDTRPYEDAVCQLYGPSGTLIVQTGDVDDLAGMIVSKKMLSPANMLLLIAVPEHHIWDDIIRVSLITFVVLLVGILVAGLLIRRLWRDQEEYVRAETENKVLEKELRIASNIQKNILRVGDRDKVKSEDKWQDMELQAALIPMREVGGDLYDFYRKEDDLYFIIGDVSGKSVPAAMFMSATVNLFRSAVRRLQSPKAIMEDINAVLSDNNPSMMFVTAFVGRLHIPTGEVLYCNAGHLPPIKVQRDKVSDQVTKDQGLRTKEIALIPNIPLGYEGRFRFEEQGMLLGKDETLVLYTDGLTEVRNEQHEMLGMQRWLEMVAANISSTGGDNVSAIRKAEIRFIGKAEQTDDMTLMTIRLTKEVQPLVVRVDNRLDQLPVIRTALHNYGLCAGPDKRTLKRLEVALEEAVVNIINYSQAEWAELRVETSSEIESRKLIVTLSDNGVSFDPTNKVPSDKIPSTQEGLKDENGEWRIGGLGIALLRQIADELHYRRIDNQNELTIIKNI